MLQKLKLTQVRIKSHTNNDRFQHANMLLQLNQQHFMGPVLLLDYCVALIYLKHEDKWLKFRVQECIKLNQMPPKVVTQYNFNLKP